MYVCRYHTPPEFDDLVLTSDGRFLTGLWFDASKDAEKHAKTRAKTSAKNCAAKDLPIFAETCKWLDIYFSGREPDFTPKLGIENLTPFRDEVQKIMLKIPYGKTTTYGDIAAEIAKSRGIAKMSSRAVGGAVGWNPICLIIPCHRVVGANGSITGYGGGVKNKTALLKLEGADAGNPATPAYAKKSLKKAM